MPNEQGLSGIFRMGEAIMPNTPLEQRDAQGEHTAQEVKKLSTYPISLQSFLQTALLIITLIGSVAYMERRLTTLEQEQSFQREIVKEQKELLKDLQKSQTESIGNQETMIELLRLNSSELERKPNRAGR